MIAQRIVNTARMWPSISLGLVLGLVVAMLGADLSTSARDWYDNAYPPATARLLMAAPVGSDMLRFRLEITRHRNCDFGHLVGYSGDGQLVPADVLRREDGGVPQSYPGGATVISRPWVLMPWQPPRLVLYGHYHCDGRPVRVKLIDEQVRP